MGSPAAGEHVHVARGGLPRPAPGSPGPRHGVPKPGVSGGSASSSGGASPSGRSEWNWWGAGARQAATPFVVPRRQRSGGRSRPSARVPTGKGNRELVRRALSPPGAARGVLRWRSFRPAPSRLRNASSSTSPASPQQRPS